MTHPWVLENCVKCYPDITLQGGAMTWTRILEICVVTFGLGDITFGQGHDISLGQGQLCDIFRLEKWVRSYVPDKKCK